MCSDSDSDSPGEEQKRRTLITVIARRRFAAAAAVVRAEDDMENGSKRRSLATRKYWQGHVSQEGYRVFRHMHRKNIYFCNDLLSRVQHKIETYNIEMAVRSSGSAVCAEIRLALSLRYLAGGSFWDIRSNFGVSPVEFYRSVWKVVDALNDELPVDLDISDDSRLARLEEVFDFKSSRNAISGAIGAIDGSLIWQKTPGTAVNNPNRYYCAHKETFALLLLAIADADRRIIWFNLSCAPSTHDSLAWATTDVAQRLDRGELKYPYLLLCDSAFTCTIYIISPGKDDGFNFEQSSLRINVECAFGELIRRWGILWHPLEMEFRKHAPVIGCCILLHNYCVDCRIEIDEQLMKTDGLVEIMPGQELVPPYVNEHGIPTENIRNEFRCRICSSQTRATTKADTRLREQL